MPLGLPFPGSSYYGRAYRRRSGAQFPVYDGGNLPVGSPRRESVEKNVENGLISIGDTRVRDVLEYEEEKDNYPFIGRDANGYEVKELFKKRLDKGKRPDAVLITENGNADDAPLGIITSWAMLKRYKGVSAENGLPEDGRTLTGPPFYFMKRKPDLPFGKARLQLFTPSRAKIPSGHAAPLLPAFG